MCCCVPPVVLTCSCIPADCDDVFWQNVMQVCESTNDRDKKRATSAGFMRSGKVRGKYSFHVSQGMSGKVRETCDVQGKISTFLM